MAFKLEARLDDAKFRRQLRKNGDLWAKAVESTIKDMRRRAPVVIARTASGVYNIPKSRINPNNKRINGSVSISGGLTDLTLTYVGTPLSSKRFAKGAVDPSSAGNDAPYKITAEYVRGRRTVIGHWAPPGTEGGRYGMKSPRMYIPGIGRFGPVQREGKSWKGGTYGPSVPQMVVNRGTGENEVAEISKLMDDRLAHHLERVGL